MSDTVKKEEEISIQSWEQTRNALGNLLCVATLTWYMKIPWDEAKERLELAGGCGDFWVKLADAAASAVEVAIYEDEKAQEKEAEAIEMLEKEVEEEKNKVVN